ncbi:MAG: hypothetical protein U0807_12280 [Candidatus Binatia bacterium]
MITLQLVADDHDEREIAVSTSIQVNPGEPHWQAWLVNAVTTQAHEGAKRLRDQLAARHALPDDGFIPLAAVAPVVDLAR